MATRFKTGSAHRSRLLYNGAIIDAHNHIGMDLEGVTQLPQSLLRKMEQSHVQKCIIFRSTRSSLAKRFRLQNDYIAKVVAAHPEKFIGFARTDPQHPLAVDEVRRAVKQLGLKGLKLHPRSQMFNPSDEQTLPLLEACVGLRVPILFHSGYAYDPIPPMIGQVAQSFPELSIIMGHMGCSEVCTPTASKKPFRSRVATTTFT